MKKEAKKSICHLNYFYLSFMQKTFPIRYIRPSRLKEANAALNRLKLTLPYCIYDLIIVKYQVTMFFEGKMVPKMTARVLSLIVSIAGAAVITGWIPIKFDIAILFVLLGTGLLCL